MEMVFQGYEADASYRMLQQTLSYLDNFARFTRKENVEAVERLLSSATQLSKFERAQLGTSTVSPSHCLHRTSHVLLRWALFPVNARI